MISEIYLFFMVDLEGRGNFDLLKFVLEALVSSSKHSILLPVRESEYFEKSGKITSNVN